MPLFIGLRAGREADLDFCVRSVRDLWHTDQRLADAAERVGVLGRFPELQPSEEGITDESTTPGTPVTRWPAVTRHSLRWGCWTRTSRGPASAQRSSGFSPTRRLATPQVCGRPA